MSKAVLVIDMPTTCVNCMFCLSEICWLKKRSVVEFNPETRVYTYLTPEWCPLKALPEKKETSYQLDTLNVWIQWQGNTFRDGWNACIDEIVGDENETRL